MINLDSVYDYIRACGEPLPDESDDGNQLLLIYAAQSNNLPAVEAIVSSTVAEKREALLHSLHYVRVVNGYRCASNPALEASTVGAIEVIDYLRKQGADLTVCEGVSRHTICHGAAFFGQYRCLKYLVEDAGLVPFTLNASNETPIASAIYYSEELNVPHTSSRFDCAAYLFSLLVDAPSAEVSAWLSSKIARASIATHFEQHSSLFEETKLAWSRIGREDLVSLFSDSVELVETIRSKSISRPYLTELTDRQRQCLHYTLYGKSAKQIGNVLDISAKTVESHLESIKQHFGCLNKQALIQKVIDLGYFKD